MLFERGALPPYPGKKQSGAVPTNTLHNFLKTSGSLGLGAFCFRPHVCRGCNALIATPFCTRAGAPPILEFPNIEETLMLRSNNVVSFEERESIGHWLEAQWAGTRRDKAEVLMIVNAMGTGKTAALKRIATDSNHTVISQARQSGRLIVQDCRTLIDALGPSEERCVELFWSFCIAVHATRLFAGHCVAGISFEDVSVAVLLSDTRDFSHKQWTNSILGKPLDAAIAELKRLTDTVHASDAHAVFFLDSIDTVSNITSRRYSRTAQMQHTLLTRLLNILEPQHFCMVAGLSDGKIERLCEYSNFVPLHGGAFLTLLSLPATVVTFGDFYPDLQPTETQRRMLENFYIVTHGNPRLNRIAIDEIVASRLFATAVDRWEQKVCEYYRNRRERALRLSVEDRARMCVASVAGWSACTLEECIPGTATPWSAAVEDSLVFAEKDDKTIVFSLPPFVMRSWEDSDLVCAAIANLVPGLNWDRIVFDVLDWFKLEQLRDKKKLSGLFEELVLSLFVMKFFVHCWAHSLDLSTWVPFSSIYPCAFSDIKTCLGQGLFRPRKEMFTNSPLCDAAVYNVNTNNAHHDGLLPFKFYDTEPQWMAVGIRYGHAKSGSELTATTKKGSSQVYISKKEEGIVPLYLSVCNEVADGDAVAFSQPDLAEAAKDGTFRQISGRSFRSRQLEVMHWFKLACAKV